ncbi:hypothetical protein EES45_04610 [Streptomyces sp. ADI97-07]|nr:hypothetical protein EES45_04610 [Streptomyces sp. ADI97-07]
MDAADRELHRVKVCQGMVGFPDPALRVLLTPG